MARTPRGASKGASGVVRRLPATITRDLRQEAVVEAVRKTGLTPRSAALSCGVSASTFYDWMDADEAFRDRIAIAERQFERSMASVIVVAALKTRSWRAALAVLERRFPDLWGPSEKVDMRIDGFVRTGFESLSDEDIDARLAELRADQAESEAAP